MRRFLLIFALFVCPGLLLADNSLKPGEATGNDARAVRLLGDVLHRVGEPKIEGQTFFVFVHAKPFILGNNAEALCSDGHCMVFLFRPLLDLLTDDEVKAVFLHELGHVFYDETVGQSLKAQLHADAFALAHSARCGLDPAVFLSLIYRLQHLQPDPEWKIRFAATERFLRQYRQKTADTR